MVAITMKKKPKALKLSKRCEKHFGAAFLKLTMFTLYKNVKENEEKKRIITTEGTYMFCYAILLISE